MKFIKLGSICLISILFLSISVQGKEWRGIVPLRSTRADVERLIGKPNFKYGIYDLEDARVDILYSSAPCTVGLQGAWNVPPDTVINITLSPKRNMLFSQLRINFRRFKKTQGAPAQQYATYTDEEEGITYVVFEGEGEDYGMISKIYYGPKAKDKKLQCSATRRGLCFRNYLEARRFL
jgi:hypothetical protein